MTPSAELKGMDSEIGKGRAFERQRPLVTQGPFMAYLADMPVPRQQAEGGSAQ